MRIRLKNYRIAYIILKIIRFIDNLTCSCGTGFFKMDAEEYYMEGRDIQTDTYYLITWGRRK